MSDMTQRERRRQQFQKEKPKIAPKDAWKVARIPILILVLWVASMGAAYAVTKDGPQCPGHWHSTMTLVVNDQAISYAHPAYTLEREPGGADIGMSLSMHMHQGSAGIWHFEPPTPRCIAFEDALDIAETEVTNDGIRLTGHHADMGQAGEFLVNETHGLRAFRQLFDADWEEVSPESITDRQLEDGERVLFVYGEDVSDEVVAEEQQRATPLSENLAPQEQGASPVPYIVITVVAVVALAIWNEVRKQA